MTEGVIDLLEAVCVDDGDGFHALEVRTVGFIIAARVGVRHRIQEEVHVSVVVPVKEQTRAVRVDPAALVETAQEFEHAWCTVQVQVLRHHEVHIGAGELQLIERRLLRIGTGRGTVRTGPVVIPEGGAVLLRVPENTLLIELEHIVGRRVDETHDVKHGLQAADILEDDRGGRIQRSDMGREILRFLHLRVQQLADRRDVVIRTEIRPERTHTKIAPVVLVTDREEDAHGELRIFLRRQVHRIPQALEVLLAEIAEVVRTRDVLHAVAVLWRLVPVCHIREA